MDTSPANFEIAECTEHSITIEWDINNSDNYLEYKLVEQFNDSNDWKTMFLTTKDVSTKGNGRYGYKLQNLSSDTCYELKMCSVDNYQVKSQYTKPKTTKTLSIGLPDDIKRLKEEDIDAFIKLMQSEKQERRYYVRIMIVGRGEVGKTCLMRRLLKESIDDVTSTEVLDIVVRKCKINIDDGSWTIDKDIYDDLLNRLQRAVIQSEIVEKESITQSENIEMDSKVDVQAECSENMREQSDASDTISSKHAVSIHQEVLPVNRNDKRTTYRSITNLSKLEISTSGTPNAGETGLNFNSLENMPTSNNETKHDIEILDNDNNIENFIGGIAKDNENLEITENNSTLKDIEHDNKSPPFVMPENLMSSVLSTTSNSDIPTNHHALCGLWDFAGQKEFYATHQAFLTSSAIYLVVANIADDISEKAVKQYFADYDKVGEYVDFWFDTIHCHRTVDKGISKQHNDHIDPPVIIVFTGKDEYEKIHKGKKTVAERMTELQNQLDDVLKQQSKYHHFRDIFCLSNTDDPDEEFEKLRLKISTTAKKMKNWGELMPLKWILLEHLIEINKNEGKHFINFSDMVSLANHPEIKMTNIKDVEAFLRFQNKEGNIIFFDDMQEFIILNPQWLVNSFRCLVSDKIDANLQHRSDWGEFKHKGKLSESLIKQLFKSRNGEKFIGQSKHLLRVMEKFDIIIKIDGTSSYIMPSMMPSADFHEECNKIGIEGEDCKRTSWLCLKFEFLPQSFFNHFYVWFIREYKSKYTVNEEQLLAHSFRGFCFVDIDDSCCKKLLVTMSTDTIALQLLSFSKKEEDFGNICSNIRYGLIEHTNAIKKRYDLEISYELHFKCSKSQYDEDSISYQQLKLVSEYRCRKHTHETEELYLPWMGNASVRNDAFNNEWNMQHEEDERIQVKTNDEAINIFYHRETSEENIQIPRAELRMLQEQFQAEISIIKQRCVKEHVTLNIDNVRALIQGNSKGVKDAKQKIDDILRSIYKKKYTMKKAGIVKHMTSEQGKTKISQVERRNKVVVHLQTGEDSDDDDQVQPISPNKTYTETAMCIIPSGQTIITVVGDITELDVDVIVNAANKNLNHVGGLAKVIVDKGGNSIQKECDDYLRAKNRARRMYEGEIFCSAPGNLNCKMIAHAVGPVWQNGRSSEDEYLSECIETSLEKTEDMKYRSIAIPALCTGIFGYPANKATKVIVETIRDYMKGNGASSSVRQIYLCDVKEDIVDHFLSAVERFFDKANVKKQRGRSGFVSSPPVRSRHGSSDYGPSPSPRRPSTAGSHISVTLVKGWIATQEVDVIVNTTSTSLQLNQGAVSQSLLKMGGTGIQAECSQKYPTGIQPGDVAETSGGQIECKMICHGALPGYNGATAMKIMETFMKTCLQTAHDNGFVSVAFPALGTGNLGYPKNQVAKNMFSCVDRFSSNHPTSSVCDVRFVVYEKDYPTIKAFEEEQRKRQSGEYVSRQTRNLGPDGTTDQDQGASGGWHQRALADNRQASVDIGDLTLKVYQGDLTEATVDVIVNGTNRDLDLTRGGVSQAILKKGGHELSQLLSVPAPKKEMKREGVATTTAGRNFSCDFIIHINMEDSHVDLKDKFKTVLEKVDELNKKSVALPALGAGISYAIDKVAESLFDALISFQKKNTNVSEVHVVIYEKEKVSQFLVAIQNCIQSQSNQSQGLFSRFKGMLGYGEKKAVSTKPWAVSKMPSSVLNLVVYAKKQNDADSALRSLEESLINDYKEKLIEDTVVKDLTKEQEAKIMKLEETCEVEIEFNRRIGRIKVRGLIENLSEAMDKVHKISRDLDRQKQKQNHAKLVADMVQWYVISVEDTGQKLEGYPAEVNLLLEQAFLNNEPQAFFLDNSGNKYIVDLTNYEEYPEDDPSDTVAVLRKSKMTDSAFDMPSNWTAMDPNENIKIVTLQTADKEYQDVVKDFLTNMAENYNSIVKIEKIQNRTLQQQYAAKKKSMDSTNAKGNNNELKLWHGTAMEAVDSINTYGFNRSYCGKNAVAYDNGVYFAVNPTYSAQAQYARPEW
ncbi:Hypothetical predicted protein [Mytilus galloprovincialis]|uniref:Poly [ADP-ribose] polymerase n=1 Tax=Mytilus galloprovincialis TaxID=29158 RepID=A0A8B6C5B2_MYTGA|nr:Hypothetical predicted protein [Mytilus galloprovincialis]